MANYQLLTDYGRYKAGSLLSDEAGDPIASIIANGAPLVPTVTALMATAQQVKDTFGQPSKPEWQASAVMAAMTVVAEEGTVLNARPVLNFLGAGVTAADDPSNNRINITIAAETITGWTHAAGIVYPTTATDDVAMGVQAMEGTERLRVVNSVPLVAAFESTDPGAVGCTLSTHHRSASPASNDVVYRHSAFGEADAGVPTKTEMGRLELIATDVVDGTEDSVWDLYAMDAGALKLAGRFTNISGSASWMSTLADGAVPAFRIRSTSDFTAANPVLSIEDNAGVGVLAQFLGDGDLNLAGGCGMFGTAAPAAKSAHIADTAGDDAAAVNAILDVLELFGLVATV